MITLLSIIVSFFFTFHSVDAASAGIDVDNNLNIRFANSDMCQFADLDFASIITSDCNMIEVWKDPEPEPEPIKN